MLLLKVSGVFYGSHFWPGGPSPFCHLHNHYFGFRVLIEVEGDRQIEFTGLANEISNHMSAHLTASPGSSCESLAQQLSEWLLSHDLRVDEVEVNEDNSSGAIVRS